MDDRFVPTQQGLFFLLEGFLIFSLLKEGIPWTNTKVCVWQEWAEQSLHSGLCVVDFKEVFMIHKVGGIFMV